MYEYIQNNILETTVRVILQSLSGFFLLSYDVWSFAEVSVFGEEAEEDTTTTLPMPYHPMVRNDALLDLGEVGEVGEIGWEYEYQDCLTSLYAFLHAFLFDSPAPRDDDETDEEDHDDRAHSHPRPPVVPYPEKYNQAWKDRIASSRPWTPKDELDTAALKHKVLLETTPFGNVLMYYDAEKESFLYYSDKTLSYPVVNAVGKKYVLTFRCEALYRDAETPGQEQGALPSLEVAAATNPTEEVKTGQSPLPSVFAKFKNYKTASSSATTAATTKAPYKNTTNTKTPTVPVSPLPELPKNRYTCEGKLANYQFLQKVAKVKPFSYKDFKRKGKPHQL